MSPPACKVRAARASARRGGTGAAPATGTGSAHEGAAGQCLHLGVGESAVVEGHLVDETGEAGADDEVAVAGLDGTAGGGGGGAGAVDVEARGGAVVGARQMHPAAGAGRRGPRCR